MKAAYIRQPGPPENIVYGKAPSPSPVGSQVLVKVAAVALNPVDTYIRSGMYPIELPKPYIVGCDLAGTVEEVGPDARRFKPGDRVWGSNQGALGRQGTFAEYAAVDEAWLYPTPDEVSDREAAGIAMVGLTAHLGLFRDAKLQPRENVFVHGGAGGVGSCVVQMAKAIGARVLATAGNDEKVKICRQLGADMAVNYKTEKVETAIRKFGPIDVWFETLRQHDLEEIVGHIAIRGRIIVMAGRDSRPVLPIGPFYTKDCSIHGYVLFNAPPEEQRKSAAEINRWMARGRLRAHIGRVMKLSETAAAHQLQEESTLRGKGTLVGKIVLEP